MKAENEKDKTIFHIPFAIASCHFSGLSGFGFAICR
jgi:hypothetical protein